MTPITPLPAVKFNGKIASFVKNKLQDRAPGLSQGSWVRSGTVLSNCYLQVIAIFAILIFIFIFFLKRIWVASSLRKPRHLSVFLRTLLRAKEKVSQVWNPCKSKCKHLESRRNKAAQGKLLSLPICPSLPLLCHVSACVQSSTNIWGCRADCEVLKLLHQIPEYSQFWEELQHMGLVTDRKLLLLPDFSI